MNSMMVVLPNREGTSRPLCQSRPLTEPPRGAAKRLLRRLGAVVATSMLQQAARELLVYCTFRSN